MKYINIFVYGTLKKGYPNHSLCANATRIVSATIKGTMYDTTYGFPAVQLKGDYDIYGQVITVPQVDLPYFDYLQGVPRLYQREQIDVKVENKIEKCFIYTMRVLPFGASIVGSGNW